MPLRRTERSDGRKRPRWKDGSHISVENRHASESRTRRDQPRFSFSNRLARSGSWQAPRELRARTLISRTSSCNRSRRPDRRICGGRTRLSCHPILWKANHPGLSAWGSGTGELQGWAELGSGHGGADVPHLGAMQHLQAEAVHERIAEHVERVAEQRVDWAHQLAADSTAKSAALTASTSWSVRPWHVQIRASSRSFPWRQAYLRFSPASRSRWGCQACPARARRARRVK